MFSKVVGPVYTTTGCGGELLLLYIVTNLVSIDFNMCLSNECELLFSSGFNLHFPDHSLDRASFHMFIDHLCFLLGKCLFVLCVFPIGLFVFLLKFLGIFCLKQNFILIPEVKTLVW